jgi:hypothetical protein
MKAFRFRRSCSVSRGGGGGHPNPIGIIIGGFEGILGKILFEWGTVLGSSGC